MGEWNQPALPAMKSSSLRQIPVLRKGRSTQLAAKVRVLDQVDALATWASAEFKLPGEAIRVSDPGVLKGALHRTPARWLRAITGRLIRYVGRLDAPAVNVERHFACSQNGPAASTRDMLAAAVGNPQATLLIDNVCHRYFVRL